MKKFIYVILALSLPSILLAQNITDGLDTDTEAVLDSENIITDSIDNTIMTENTDNTDNTIITEDTDNIIDTEINDEVAEEEYAEYVWLWNIHFWFCDQWVDNLSKWLNIAIEQWKTSEVCIAFYNDAKEDITINIDYTILGVDQDWWPSCSIDNSFEQYIENIDQIKQLVIPWWELVQTSMKLNFPIWIEWDLWWCLAFSLEDDQWDNNWGWWIMISTIFRRAFHMHFFVGWIQDIKNELEITNIETYLNWNKEVILKFDITNTWNLENSLEISWDISNMFGYKKDFIVEWWRIMPNRTLPIEINIWTIASYGWLFNIDININSTPFFSYDISNSSIDPTLLKSKEFTASTTFFQMPWLIIIIVVIVILLIITIFRKPKEKVVYVQTPQQPTPNNGYNAYQQPQYQVPQQPQVAQPQPQPQYQQPQVQPQYGQPNQDPNNYWQPNQQ